MNRSRTDLIASASSPALNRGVSRNNKSRAIRFPKPALQPGESTEQCYRALLKIANCAVLVLSPESIILEWNRAAETVSGRLADEVLGRSYAELCLPMKAHEPFLAELARVASGNDVQGLEFPLLARTGAKTMLSWNITRALGTRGELIGLMAVGTVVVSHVQVEEELLLAHAKLCSEARRAQRAIEEERRRIARELHDEFGQALTGLNFDLAWLGRRLTQPPAPAECESFLNKVQSMSGSVDALLKSVRSTAAALRPAMLDDLGLVAALECLATRFQDRTGARCTIDVASELSFIALPSETSDALFRIAQELLTNVMRHAAASQVRIRLYRDCARVTLEVTDNGKGITRERMATLRSFGLRGMQERAALLGGHFHIVGSPGIGTTAIASVPACRPKALADGPVVECFTP